jgi:hypothetical protein
MLVERRKRRYRSGIRTVFHPPCYTGDTRPDAATIPLETREAPQETKDFLKNLGYPESRMADIKSRETRLMSLYAYLAQLKTLLRTELTDKKREIIAVVTTETLQNSRMSDDRIAAVYEAMTGEGSLRSVASRRGVDVRQLKRLVRKCMAKTVTGVCLQLAEWAAARPDLAEAWETLTGLRSEVAASLADKPSIQEVCHVRSRIGNIDDLVIQAAGTRYEKDLRASAYRRRRKIARRGS